jgi:hypothetical protein
MILEFKTQLDDNVIYLPEEVAAQFKNGTAIHVSIRPAYVEGQTSKADDVWQAFLQVTSKRQSLITDEKPYYWKRDDAYEHLK